MNNTLTINRKIINYGIPLVLFGALVSLTKTVLFKENPVLGLAVTIDLLVSVPFIYFLFIRKSQIRKVTIIPVVLIGLLLASYFLPKESQSYLTLFKIWIVPVLELSLIFFITIKFHKALKRNRNLAHSNQDFYNILKSSCAEVLPKRIATVFATEIAVFYYGFINWKKRDLKQNEFSYHKNSGTQALYGAFILVLIIETIAFHFLLARWSAVAAWILTALSAYTAVQVFGFAKSILKRPIVIGKDHLVLRYGMINEIDIAFEDIKSIELSSTLETQPLTKTLSPIGKMEGHNVIITLAEESMLIGIYGIKKRVNVIACSLDEPVDFKAQIEFSMGRTVN